ncbi:MAG: phosphoglycerate dehydrogenase [Micrococcales bacterium]|nr:phosphoglycerate dehydrogenase [Micrococcales bacterium]
MRTALLLENLHPQAHAIVREAGFEVHTRTSALDEAELIDALAGVSVLGIRSKTQVSAEVLAHAPQLLVIGTYTIGTNQIDLGAAAARGIATFNAPFSNTRSVVEIALADIIALTRRLTVLDKQMHAGVWDKSAEGAHEVRGRTLGIVGYGNIGTQLSVLAENLGMSVIFYDIAEKLALGNARKMASMEALLAEADIVTLHVDGRPGNAGLFGAEQFAVMKPGAVFLNLSRGFIVDYAALREAIESGAIVGAAADVFPVEPKRRGDPFTSELRGLDNVILSPHTGGSTEEAQESIGQFVSTKIRDYLATGSTTLSVNLPNIALDRPDAVHRLAYLHQNVPGVLANVNQTLARFGLNIEAQMLATSGNLGYVVTDVPDELHPGMLEELRQRPETIALRVIS